MSARERLSESLQDALGASRVVELPGGRSRGPLDLLALAEQVRRLRGSRDQSELPATLISDEVFSGFSDPRDCLEAAELPWR